MADISVKKRAFLKVLEVIEQRQHELEFQLMELQQALLSDTKSSAGDKHETSRAMTQLEQEKLGKQMQELNQLQHTFLRISFNDSTDRIQLGNLVETNEGWYFLCVPLGKVTLTDGTNIFCLSPISPLGKQFLGRKKDEALTFNARSIQILSVH